MMSPSNKGIIVDSSDAGDNLMWFKNVPEDDLQSFKNHCPSSLHWKRAWVLETTLLLNTIGADEPWGAWAAALFFSVYLPIEILEFGLIFRITGEKYNPDAEVEWSINGVKRTEKNPSLSIPFALSSALSSAVTFIVETGSSIADS